MLLSCLLSCYFRWFFLGETVLEKVKEIGKKLDELRGFLEDVFLTKEEDILLKETDKIVRNKRFNELKSLVFFIRLKKTKYSY